MADKRKPISYARAIAPTEDDNPNKPDDKSSGKSDEYFTTTFPKSRRVVRNIIPPKGNSSRDAWEYSYAPNLLEIQRIMYSGIRRVKPGFKKIDFDLLSEFLYDNSSKHISPYLEDLKPHMEEKYTEYLTRKQMKKR